MRSRRQTQCAPRSEPGIELEGDDTYYAPAAEEVLAIIEAQTGETASAVARLPKLLNPITSAGSRSSFNPGIAAHRSGVGSAAG